jgi:protein SCO1/2|tara:strand:- start:17393 stop:18082 length:690 start_codon:yes stop_codon:yes gene_type:complete
MGLKKSEYLKIGGILLVFSLGIFLSIRIQTPDFTLPILNPNDLNPGLVDESLQSKGIDHTVAPFSLISQNGMEVTQDDVENHIRIINYFFTTCPGICLDMAKSLRKVQSKYIDNDAIKIMSHSAMPQYDTPEVLKNYADQNSVDYNRWILLTGDPVLINKLARTSYFTVLKEGEGWDEHSFIHTENLVLVDHKGRLRGYYDGTSDDDTNLLIDHIALLLNERLKDLNQS